MTSSKTWLITGASGGLGLALTQQALAHGHHVVATTRGAGLDVDHPHLTVLQLDPADRAACRRTAAAAAEVTGRLDVLVNNAGYGLVGAIEEVSEAEARSMVDVNLLGPLWLSQAVLPQMREQGEGHIIQISSVGAVGAMPFFGLYNAAKWGLEGFSEAMASEVEAKGVRVTLAEIGEMDTGWATTGMQFSGPLAVYDALRTQVLGTSDVPWACEPGATGGGTSPEDIARAIIDHDACGTATPRRLVLGEGAADQISTVLDLRLQDYASQRPPADDAS